MPIDLDRVVGARLRDTMSSWTSDDVILYHLGLGAGVPPTSPQELAYVYESGLKVLPTYGVIPALDAIEALLALDGLDIDLAQMLHGEQDLVVHETLPAKADVITRSRVAEIFDKGTAALIVLEMVTSTVADDRPLCTNRVSAFVRGEGGFGGQPGPAAGNAVPDRGPDHVVVRTTLPQQALLYRLTGDKNPLHADPAFAARGGFDRPILHGLCSYGIVAKAAVDTVLGGDVTAVARFQARFAGVVFPGETIEVSLWEQDDRILVAARTVDRNSPVLSNAAMTLR
jgi:acyl dehydratase